MKQLNPRQMAAGNETTGYTSAMPAQEPTFMPESVFLRLKYERNQADNKYWCSPYSAARNMQVAFSSVE